MTTAWRTRCATALVLARAFQSRTYRSRRARSGPGSVRRTSSTAGWPVIDGEAGEGEEEEGGEEEEDGSEAKRACRRPGCARLSARRIALR